MDRMIAIRLPTDVAEKLGHLAAATGRPRAHIVRLFLSRACAEDIPTAWFATAREQRIATGECEDQDSKTNP